MLKDLLPYLKSSWEKRKHRPLPESVEFTRSKFDKIWIVDSSVLEALFKKLKSLEEITQGQLAGKIGVVIDLVTRLPVEIWFKENPRTNDTKLEQDILNLVTGKTLLLLDRGFYHFSFWLQLIEREIHFISRLKKGASIKVEKVFTDSYSIRAPRSGSCTRSLNPSGFGNPKNSLCDSTFNRSSLKIWLAFLCHFGA